MNKIATVDLYCDSAVFGELLTRAHSHPQHAGANRAERRAAAKANRAAPTAPRRPAADPRAALTVLRESASAAICEPLNASQRLDVSLGYHAALAALMSGQGCAEDLNTLALTSNITLLLCEYGLGLDEIDDAKTAQDAVVFAVARGERTGRWLLSGSEIRPLQKMCALHDAQLASPACTEAVMVGAIREIRARVSRRQVLTIGAKARAELAEGVPA